MQHGVEESDTGPYPDFLARRYLGRMVGLVLVGDGCVGWGEVFVGEDVGFGEVIEGAAVEG